MFWTPAFAGVTTQETFYEVIKIEGCQIGRQVLEGQQRLDMVEGKTKDAQALQHDIKSLRAEGARRVFEVLDKLSNKQKKAFLRIVIDGRLALDPQGKPHGSMNLAAGYEYLARFATSSS